MNSRPTSLFHQILTIGTTLQICRYGIEIGRLLQAQIEAKKGYDIARRGGVAPAVLQDTKVSSYLFNTRYYLYIDPFGLFSLY